MKSQLLLIIILGLLGYLKVNAQTVINMQEDNGVYTMPCKVNGLKLKFIFDTGASDVSISLTEAVFMIKNGYLIENDIIGTTQYSIANGDVTEGTKINLKEVIIGNLKLHNIEAGVVHSLEAPLLLGQSALKKLGKIEFDYLNNTLTINNGETTEFFKDSVDTNLTVTLPEKLNYYAFKMLPKREQNSIILNSKLAKREYNKYKVLKSAGIVTLALGTGTIIEGIVLDAKLNKEELNVQNNFIYDNTGGYVAAVGAGVCVVGIGIWALAPRKIRNAIYYYNKEHNYSLNLNPSLNGIGLTLNF